MVNVRATVARYQRLPSRVSSLEARTESLEARAELAERRIDKNAETHAVAAAILEARIIERIKLESTLRCLDMREATVQALRSRLVPLQVRKAAVAQPIPLDEAFTRLESRFPNSFPIWRELFENARHEYAVRPETSLSVAGNDGARAFRSFLAPYLDGHVLDIGCGPQPMPLYLEGYRIPRLAGLDPLTGSATRCFEFAQGVAEFIPWPDGEFDTVIAATSFDHVLSIDLALDEVARILDENGRFVLWISFVPGSPPYDPETTDCHAIDRYHMFHFDRGWFEKILSERFVQIERFELNSQSAFYSFARRTFLGDRNS